MEVNGYKIEPRANLEGANLEGRDPGTRVPVGHDDAGRNKIPELLTVR